MTKKPGPIVIVGGGTGGHITPALAVAEALTAMGRKVHFIGSHQGMERELVLQANLPFQAVQAGKLRRYFSWANLIDFLRVAVGFWQARNILAKLKPAVVFAKGGYVSVPVVYAAAFLEIPIIGHESDVVMGLANRLTLTKASLMCTGFPVKAYPQTIQPKLRFTGNPVRPLFNKKLPTREVLAAKYDLPLTKPIVVVMGGSQGALPINQLLLDNLKATLQFCSVIHITGVDHLELALAAKEQLPASLQDRYLAFGFVGDELPELLSLADLVITRSSANTLNELALLGKPTLLVPLPHSASDHQRANARVFAESGAAIVVEQADLTPASLSKQIKELLHDKEQLRHLSRAIRSFSSPQAATIIAEAIVEAATTASR